MNQFSLDNDYAFDDDQYAQFAADFDPMQNDRQARRKRKPKVKHTPKKAENEIIEEIADTAGMEGGFEITYRPSLHEAGWLMDSLQPFYEEHLIDDVLAILKGGKEASVYRCNAVERGNNPFLAAKVYRPRMFRNLRNDKMYREGRDTLTLTGRPAKHNDQRLLRAMDKRTSFGAQMAHTSWLMHEFNTLKMLHEAGAAVPHPISAGSNAILMTYYGDERMAAPTLQEVDLDRDEAQMVFNEVMYHIDLMLRLDVIHGDLSAFNILYWEGQIVLIDFPQVIDPHVNSNAYSILERDITRVCEYFQRKGVDCNEEAITTEMWQRYLAVDPEDRKADLSRYEEEEEID